MNSELKGVLQNGARKTRIQHNNHSLTTPLNIGSQGASPKAADGEVAKSINGSSFNKLRVANESFNTVPVHSNNKIIRYKNTAQGNQRDSMSPNGTIDANTLNLVSTGTRLPTATGKVNATTGMKELLRKHAYGEAVHPSANKTSSLKASSLDKAAVAQHFDQNFGKGSD